MRLVLMTNTQKTSAPRLSIRLSVGAKPCPFEKEDCEPMSDSWTAATSELEFAAFAAMDWADQKNFWRLLPAGSRRSEAGELENTPEAVEAWAAGLQQRFGGGPIAVIVEQSRGALVYMLTKYPHLVLFPVHPTTAARLPADLRAFGSQERPQRHRILAGSVAASSRTAAAPAAGHCRNPPVAFPGGGTSTDGG